MSDTREGTPAPPSPIPGAARRVQSPGVPRSPSPGRSRLASPTATRSGAAAHRRVGHRESSGGPGLLARYGSFTGPDPRLLGPDLDVVEQIPTSQLNIGDEIGKGRFKRVHRGRHKRRDVVILRYTKDDSNANELQILSLLARPGGSAHVPEIYGVSHDRDVLLVVQELATGGALKNALKNPETTELFSFMHKIHCAQQIASAMVFLESRRVVHADLSCRNVLICHLAQEDEDPRATVAKVSDFGLSVVLAEGAESETRKQPQATRWCAPENILYMRLSHRTDVWALGTLLWEMFSGGTNPWVKRDKRSDVATRLRDLAETGGSAEGGPDVSDDFPLPEECPQSAHNVVLSCLKAVEADRPTFDEVVNVIGGIIQQLEGHHQATESDASPKESEALTPSTAEPTSSSGTPHRGGFSPGIKLEWNLDADGGHFKVLKAVLRSPQAAELLGAEAVEMMAREVAEAQQREQYLLSLVRKANAARLAATATATTQMTRARSWQDRRRSMNKSHEYLVPTHAMEGVRPAPMPPPDPGMWTLWSSVGDTLQRQDFASEVDARAAFEANTAHPCMLRDPHGTEAAARAWVASYFKTGPGLCQSPVPASPRLTRIMTPRSRQVTPCAKTRAESARRDQTS